VKHIEASVMRKMKADLSRLNSDATSIWTGLLALIDAAAEFATDLFVQPPRNDQWPLAAQTCSLARSNNPYHAVNAPTGTEAAPTFRAVPGEYQPAARKIQEGKQ